LQLAQTTTLGLCARAKFHKKVYLNKAILGVAKSVIVLGVLNTCIHTKSNQNCLRTCRKCLFNSWKIWKCFQCLN